MKLKIVKDNASTSSVKAEQPLKKRDIVARWGGDERILAAGFVGVPTLFLQRMAQFKPYSLTPAEAVFIICVMAHKWDERDPFPSYKRIAGWMGKSESYVRRLAKNLAAKSLVKRQQRVGQTNSFDFKELFAKILEPETEARQPADERASAKSETPRHRQRKKRTA